MIQCLYRVEINFPLPVFEPRERDFLFRHVEHRCECGYESIRRPQHEEWIVGRWYFDMTEYFDWKAAQNRDDQEKKAA